MHNVIIQQEIKTKERTFDILLGKKINIDRIIDLRLTSSIVGKEKHRERTLNVDNTRTKSVNVKMI